MENKEWVKYESKQRPGKFYLFNTSTGETKWCPSSTSSAKRSVVDEEKTTLNLNVSKLLKTPAQDRLKRLQHKIQKEAKEKKKTEDAERCKTNSKKNGNDEFSKTPTKLSKRESVNGGTNEPVQQMNIRANEKATTISRISNTEVRAVRKRKPNMTSETLSKKSKMKPESESLATSFPVTAVKCSANVSNAITNKVKNFCKNTKQMIENIAFNIPKKCDPIKTKPVEETLKEILPQKQAKGDSKISSPTATPKVKYLDQISSTLHAPSCNAQPLLEHNSANARLQHLRRSLHSEQKLKLDLYEINNSKVTSNTTFQSINNSLQSEDFEPMDWQPIEEEEFDTTKSVKNPCAYNGNMTTMPTIVAATDTEPTMKDFYGTVNSNLLRLEAEKRCIDDESNWYRDFYYFILDTNVLLRYLSFVDDLSKMKLCDTKGTILYIPYSVLQELDKLKMRNNDSGEGVKVMAVRAIKYLNTNFEARNIHIQAQSASKERSLLIKVKSADDSIINCCLQVKEHIESVVLLSEDINLRNKAASNRILATTKQDLMSLPKEKCSIK